MSLPTSTMTATPTRSAMHGPSSRSSDRSAPRRAVRIPRPAGADAAAVAARWICRADAGLVPAPRRQPRPPVHGRCLPAYRLDRAGRRADDSR
jgi:hypothetical protein